MIRADGVTKVFRETRALDRVSLHVRRGEVLALLGPNGAGKTTLLKCLVGLYVPIEGTITIDGLDRRRDHLAIRRFTSWLADQPFLGPNFTAREWLAMVGDVHDVDIAARDARIHDLAAAFELQPCLDQRIETLSRGQGKKVALAATLLPDTRLILADEPFTGEVDPAGIAAFKQVLRDLRQRGDRTIVFATQLVDQAEALADRVAVMASGRVVEVAAPSELTQRLQVRTLEEALARMLPSDARAAATRFTTALGDPR